MKEVSLFSSFLTKKTPKQPNQTKTNLKNQKNKHQTKILSVIYVHIAKHCHPKNDEAYTLTGQEKAGS